MIRSLFFAVAATVLLGVGAGQAQEWEYLDPSQVSGGEGSDMVRIVSHRFVAAIEFDSNADKWKMLVTARPFGDAKFAWFAVERQKQRVSRRLESNDFAVIPMPNPERVVVAFWLREQELELLMSGDELFFEAGSHAHSFPLSGSRVAISQLITAIAPHREALAEDRAHTIAQARSDCDQQASHPDDERNELPGVDWSDIQAEVAVEVCRYAMENSVGAERIRMMYQLGRALDKSGDPEALDVLFAAGENYGYPSALNHLAILYRDGEYTDANSDLAERFFRAASDKGHIPAMHNLAHIWLDGAYSPEKKREAYELFHNAAAAGYPLSQEFYGKEILAGNVEKANAELAFYWLGKASKAGLGGASMAIADMYRDGIGVTASPSDYLKYLRLAAEQGDEAAKESLGLN